MTRTGAAALLAGGLALAFGLWLQWTAFQLIGIGLLALVVLAVLVVVRPSPVSIERAISPARVPKGSPAVAVLSFANRGHHAVGATVAHQPFGAGAVRTVIPRLRRGERGVRTYLLPTRRRGIFAVGPVEVVRRDAFELVRSARRFGGEERIWVYPRVLGLRPLPTGRTRHLEGASADTAPQGSITFHRLRDYVAGDDLRLVHWRSSARTGRLVVRHNVDTSQPFGVVLLDLRPGRYTAESFEAAVDVAASVVVACAAGKAPVQLRLTDGTVLGGPRLRETTALLDHLTGVDPSGTGTLRDALLALRHTRGGTSLTVVTGVLDAADLPYVAQLRRRFERLVVLSLDEDRTPAPTRFGGVRVLVAADADEAATTWNLQAHS